MSDDESKPLVWPGVAPFWQQAQAGGSLPPKFAFDWTRGRLDSGKREGEKVPAQHFLSAWGGLGERSWAGLGDSLPSKYTRQRWKYFLALLLLSGCMFLLALAFLPLVLLRPKKFCLFFTMGSLLSMTSFAVLRGPLEQARHMFSMQRLPFTSAYLGSMVTTLYAALVLHSYLLVLLCAVVQASSITSYVLSYVPGGSAVARRLPCLLLGTVRACCCRRQSSLWGSGSLPL